MKYKAQALTDRQTDRQTGVELLKVVAIFLIVTSHVTQTLGTENLYGPLQDYVLLLGNATTDIQVLILTLLRQAGELGNAIFFTCSAWFLVEKTGDSKKKAFSLLCTVWCISALILFIYLLTFPSCLTTKGLIKQLFPTCFANNWYMTCYIIFLFVYPWLNKLMLLTNQKQLLRITVFSSSLWIFADYLKSGLFFGSPLILWVSIYFLIAYIKRYCTQKISSKKTGAILLAIGILGYIGQVVITNYMGLYLFGTLSDKVLRWNNSCCPFYLMIAIGSMIIALQTTYEVKVINYISGLSMFVYLIHENYLFRYYTRPIIWEYLYLKYGYAHVVILDIVFSVALFLLSLVVGMIYKETLHQYVLKGSNKLFAILAVLYGRIECLIMQIS